MNLSKYISYSLWTYQIHFLGTLTQLQRAPNLEIAIVSLETFLGHSISVIVRGHSMRKIDAIIVLIANKFGINNSYNG